MRASRGGISQDDMIAFGFLGAIIRNWKAIEIAVASCELLYANLYGF
jgi:hypothetical protein